MTTGTTTDAAAPRARRRARWSGYAIGAILVLQAVSAVFFAYEIGTSVFGIGPPVSWRMHEAIELGAVTGLLLGVVTGALALRAAVSRRRQAETRLRDAQLAFLDLVESRFAEWDLTPAERDVALFAVKGLGTAEIARLRGTSEGTVKAQSAAIYRKAGVSNRAQLLAVLIDHLMEDAAADTRPSDAA